MAARAAGLAGRSSVQASRSRARGWVRVRAIGRTGPETDLAAASVAIVTPGPAAAGQVSACAGRRGRSVRLRSLRGAYQVQGPQRAEFTLPVAGLAMDGQGRKRRVFGLGRQA